MCGSRSPLKHHSRLHLQSKCCRLTPHCTLDSSFGQLSGADHKSTSDHLLRRTREFAAQTHNETPLGSCCHSTNLSVSVCCSSLYRRAHLHTFEFGAGLELFWRPNAARFSRRYQVICEKSKGLCMGQSSCYRDQARLLSFLQLIFQTLQLGHDGFL